MASKSSIKTPMNRVLGLGSAKDGVGHWWEQRLSSIALIPLTLLFVAPFLSAYGQSAFGAEGHLAVLAIYSDPSNAIVAILFVAVSFWHLQQGLQVVIEDYVHAKAARTTLLIGNALGCWAVAAVGVFAILKIAFTAAPEFAG
ncbi:MAG: succinate dehydrogenase, hydrophobic membrane anchor protein [Pseudomonadota bacterium]